MKLLLNFLILILALGIIAKPLPEEWTSSDSVDTAADSYSSIATDDVEVTDSSADTPDDADLENSADTSDDADSMDDSADSAVVEARAIIEGLLSPRSMIVDLSREPEASQPQGTFGELSKQITQLSAASSSLGKSVSSFSSNPSFANIYAVTVQLNTFTRAVISTAAIIKDLKPMTSSSDAAKTVALVRPMMASLTTTMQGLVKKQSVLTSLGIGCIFEELLAFLLILLLYLLELLLFLCKINVTCVKELTQYQSDVKVGMKAAIAVFASSKTNKLLL